MKQHIPDTKAREQALDASRSYIVQAPAGSGKTELLTQRFLVLLSRVKQPEEIIALTFTRKAASEMRDRVLQAIHNAKTHPEPNAPHAKTTWQLAHAVLEQDKQQQWNLLQSPNRLRIMTIDALCAYLCSRMPLLAQMTTDLNISNQPDELYKAAVQHFISELDNNEPWYQAFSNICLHCDNNVNRVQHLLVQMLQTRDQWLPFLLHASNQIDLRQQLEQSLQQINLQALETLINCLPFHLSDEILELTNFAITQLHNLDIANPLVNLGELTELPNEQPDDLPSWQAIANWLLTKDYTWRKSITKNIGFPAASSAKNATDKQLYKDYKQRMQQLLSALAEQEEFRQALENICLLPPCNYADDKWHTLEQLLILLPILAAQLKLVFKEHGKVDFVEISSNALCALGACDSPSDLGLYLDATISHLLIDEFQDTSISQFRLLEHLVEGWQTDDGRSLFLVGDPMQSIYRFRQAEVGLFLQAKQSGIGSVQLNSLQLTSNFRSSADIVAWNNQQFAKIFPEHSNSELGAIAYHHSNEILHGDSATPAIEFHAAADSQQQAEQIVVSIEAIKQQHPNRSIAILVRARSHLPYILAMLQQHEIAFQATEIAELAMRSVVQDLFALSRAIIQPLDRIAWLSVLRAPWCGLELADLHFIANISKRGSIWRNINKALSLQQNASLSSLGRERLLKLRAAIAPFVNNRQRLPLRDMIEQAWLALQGPATVDDQNALQHAATYLDLLEQFDAGADLLSLQQFSNALAQLKADQASDNSHAVQIMTIHKSKGLEFDVVFLPHLEKLNPPNTNPILLWQQRRDHSGAVHFFIAPIKASTETTDPIYEFIRKDELTKQQYETARILYVAATRARHQLHLCVNLRVNNSDNNDDENHGNEHSGNEQKYTADDFKVSNNDSFLNLLWPQCQTEFITAFNAKADSNIIDNNQLQPSMASNHLEDELALTRLSLNWQAPVSSPMPAVLLQHNREAVVTGFQRPDDQASLFGSFIHKLFEQLANGVCSLDDLKHSEPQWHAWLIAAGILPANLLHYTELLQRFINNCQTDAKAKWLLQRHAVDQAELALQSNHHDQLKTNIIDRTFITSDNTRWIIDYKTTQYDASAQVLELFLQQEREAHQSQLHKYAELIKQLPVTNSSNCSEGSNIIKLGLYFPLIPAWVEWTYE